MSIVPILNVRKILSILLKAGFKIIHQKGSHIKLVHSVTGRSTTIAFHVGDSSRKMTMKILKQAGISVSDLLELLKKL